ncbi:single-stranded DNA-binding protein [Faecalicatena fissicatena]|uniref:single-stranded DNA-binding protein n=1 Tax=Faecalicatena fissicatena TaxID=290055 RepID=UPI00156F3625|nr:single-stranded DNA-binding protein [Faecalicatena fissicatena]NSE32740.1 single-stranded DNA-binding protein [Faecalicatena fissicatena]
MNKVILMGRLTRNPEMRNSNGESNTAIARYTLAVDRRYKREGDVTADFISCVAFGRSAEFAEKYFRQGLKVVITGRIQTGSYTNRDGNKVYTTDVVVEDQEFVEMRMAAAQRNREESSQERPEPMPVDENGFMTLPEDFDEELPFA